MNLEEVKEVIYYTRRSFEDMKLRMCLFGISFKVVEKNIKLLTDFLNYEFLKIIKNLEIDTYWLKINEVEKENNYIKINAEGTYFDKREVITFYKNGQILFCGQSDDITEIPVLTAFGDWLEKIKGETK